MCIESVLLFWKNIDGVHLHNNGEETYDAISVYLQRNPNLSFVAESKRTVALAPDISHCIST